MFILFLRTIFYVVLLCTFCASAAFAVSLNLPATNNEKQWSITADNVRSVVSNTILEAEGNVTITNGTTTLHADFLRFFTTTGWFYLNGNIKAQFADTLYVTAQTAEINKDTLTGWLSNASVTLKEPYVAVTGAMLERKGHNKYLFKNATVTACDTQTPPWKFQARLLDLRIDGYTVLQDTTLLIYDVTTINIPTAIFPANVSRQTGFLLPDISLSTSEGFSFSLPFFWAIDEQQDLLVNADIMSRKGIMLSARYRGWYKPRQKVWLATNWLYETNLEELASPITKNDYVVAHNRYWIRGMFNTDLGTSSWHLRMNVDYISDISFMSDYKSGILGFDNTMKETLQLFGRELRPLRQNRISKILIEREYNRFGLAFSANYEQDLLGNQAITHIDNVGANNLPAAELFLYRQKLLGETPLATYLPFDVESDFGVSYLLNSKDSTSLARLNFTPKIALPLNFDYISIEPSATLYQRAYFDVESPTTTNKNRYVAIPEAKIDISSLIARAYPIKNTNPLTNIGDSRWTGIMHTMQPWVRYTYRPEIDQQGIPLFLPEDNLEAINGITYGFTTTLVRKKEMLKAVADKKGNLSTTTSSDYLRFLEISLFQTYYLDSNKLQKNTSFSPLTLDLKYFFESNISLHTIFDIDTVSGELTRTNISFSYTQNDFRLSTGYDYQILAPEYFQYFSVNSVFVEIETPVFFSLQVRARYAHDIKRNKPSEILGELRYVNQCYSIGLRYTQDFFDSSIGLLFSIPLL